MSYTKLMMVLLTYTISFIILYIIGEKFKLGKWINHNNRREFIALIIVSIIYSIGYVIIEKFYISGNPYYILNGLLISVPMIIVYYISSNILKKYGLLTCIIEEVLINDKKTPLCTKES